MSPGPQNRLVACREAHSPAALTPFRRASSAPLAKLTLLQATANRTVVGGSTFVFKAAK